MDSSYQIRQTHYGDLSLTVHDRISDLHRRADGLARAVAESAMDSGCTDKTRREHSGMGPRQQKAWDMIAEAHSWNAVSDDPETLNEAERLEREGIAYCLEYGSEGFQVVLTDKPQCQAETADHACVLDDDGHTGHRDGAFTWTETEHVPTERVVTSQLQVGDVVREHGMRVRIDAINEYTPDGGRCGVCHRDAHRPGMGNHSVHGHAYQPPVAWSCPGTVLNLPEVLAGEIVPASFLMTRRWEDGSGWVIDRRDAWTVQGNDLVRWTVERPEPANDHCGDDNPHRPHVITGSSVQCTGTTLDEYDQAEAGQPCPSRHPEHQAPCIAVADHLGDHCDAHGCTWTTSPEITVQGGYVVSPAGRMDRVTDAWYPADEPVEPQDLTVRFDDQAGHYRATRVGELVAFAKWSGSVLRVFLPGGTFVGRMYRSDGKIIAGETVYTYRAETGTDPLQFVGGEREVARGETMSDAVGLLLAAVANARREAGDQAHQAEPYAIDGQPACGAPVDGGRCGRAPGHEDHPHIKEPRTKPKTAEQPSGEYYVMPHGYTAPANRPVARFPYTAPDAADAFDQALAWARENVKTSYDLWHADAGRSTFIVHVMADGHLVWPLQ